MIFPEPKNQAERALMEVAAEVIDGQPEHLQAALIASLIGLRATATNVATLRVAIDTAKLLIEVCERTLAKLGEPS